MMKRYKKSCIIIVLICFSIIVFSLICISYEKNDNKEYGVFLSSSDDLSPYENYDTVVIDAQYYSREEIDDFKSKGHTVYSYLNVGSIETFRDYYDEYKNLSLGNYENWDEEYWIDVSNKKWQDFLIHKLVPYLLEKDIDGFFVDNCDVYYNYQQDHILDGLTVIMQFLISTGKPVIINGGDSYLDAYCSNRGQWSDVITGINQESVFSKILWDEDEFTAATGEDREYFQNYIERYAEKGADIYLLEYTCDGGLIKEIQKYCQKNGFKYYVSDSIELD